MVKVRVADARRAADCLRHLPGVVSASPSGAHVLVTGRDSAAVVAHLTQHGIDPTEVTSPRSDLEDQFLHLTA
jgi:hypothetical protein